MFVSHHLYLAEIWTWLLVFPTFVGRTSVAGFRWTEEDGSSRGSI